MEQDADGRGDSVDICSSSVERMVPKSLNHRRSFVRCGFSMRIYLGGSASQVHDGRERRDGEGFEVLSFLTFGLQPLNSAH